MIESTVQEPQVQERERCTQVGCKQVVGLERNDAGELRCAHHDPVRRAARDKALRQKIADRRGKGGPTLVASPEELPVASIESLDDAVTLSRWIPVALATGRIGAREAAAMVGALREYRMGMADAELLTRIEQLERRVKAARQRGLDV